MLPLTIDTQDKYTLVTVGAERLNSLNAPELKSNFVVLSNGGVRNIIINLEQVQYSDSSGISALLVGNRLCADAGGTFVVAAAKDPVKKVMKIAQIDKVINMTPTTSEAVDLVFMDEIERSIDAE